MESMTLEEYLEAMRGTLEYWLGIHTDPEKWAEGWLVEDPEYIFQNAPVIENNYFHFDMRPGVAKRMAKRDQWAWKECPECRCMYDSYDDKCPECNRTLRGASLKRVTEYYIEMAEDGCLTVDESAICETLEQDGFKVYIKELRPYIGGIVSEVKRCLRQLDSTNRQKVLLALTWATHIMHVNGNITEDYGDYGGVDYRFVNRVSEEGFAAVFGQEQLDEFLRS